MIHLLKDESTRRMKYEDLTEDQKRHLIFNLQELVDGNFNYPEEISDFTGCHKATAARLQQYVILLKTIQFWEVNMEVFYPVDKVIGDNDYQPNLPVSEIQYLNTQMNCNLYNSEEDEMWFDQENDSEMMQEIDDEWFFEYV